MGPLPGGRILDTFFLSPIAEPNIAPPRWRHTVRRMPPHLVSLGLRRVSETSRVGIPLSQGLDTFFLGGATSGGCPPRSHISFGPWPVLNIPHRWRSTIGNKEWHNTPGPLPPFPQKITDPPPLARLRQQIPVSARLLRLARRSLFAFSIILPYLRTFPIPKRPGKSIRAPFLTPVHHPPVLASGNTTGGLVHCRTEVKMSATSERVPFVEAQFLEDLEKGSADIGAPYDEKVVKEVINAHGELMYDAAIQIRGSSNPGIPILFRVLMTTPADTLDIAFRRGWLHPDDPVVALAFAARTHFKGAVEQPEFTASKGCDGLFMYLGGLRDLEEVLAVPGMPDSIKAHKDKFMSLHLNKIVTLQFQYTEELVSFYFLAQGPLSKDALDNAVALSGAPATSDAVYKDIIGVLLELPYYLTVVMDYHTGKVVKIEVHLLFPVKLPDEMAIPDVGERLTKFWDIPSHEYEDMDILSYCFGDTHLGDILALRSYCGGLRSLLRFWNIIGA